jgi:hypothetical protein
MEAVRISRERVALRRCERKKKPKHTEYMHGHVERSWRMRKEITMKK